HFRQIPIEGGDGVAQKLAKGWRVELAAAESEHRDFLPRALAVRRLHACVSIVALHPWYLIQGRKREPALYLRLLEAVLGDAEDESQDPFLPGHRVQEPAL